MKLAILGATGTVGHEIVTQALAAGHDVTALVRKQPQPDELDDRAAILVGDVMNADDVNRVVEGNDAVVSALGHVKGTPADLLARATTNVIAAMRADGVARLVVLSSPAVGEAEDRPGLRYRVGLAVMRRAIAGVVRDHRAQARVIEDSDLAWTLARGPIVFTDGAHTGHYEAGPITPSTGVKISRANLADFMLTTATNGRFIRMLPLVSE